MQIEHVAWESLASGRTAEQEGHLAIGDSLLGEIVVDEQYVHTVVAEPLTHGASAERRKKLERRGIGRRRGDDRRVVHGAGIGERLNDLCNRRALLPDGDVDAIEL